MKLHHYIAIRHSPPEIAEKYPTDAERERVVATLLRRFETILYMGSFNGKRDERPTDGAH